MESDSFNDFVICPYDKSHKLLRGRLTKHLLRCGRSSGNSNRFIICPFNENHRYDKKEFAVSNDFTVTFVSSWIQAYKRVYVYFNLGTPQSLS